MSAVLRYTVKGIYWADNTPDEVTPIPARFFLTEQGIHQHRKHYSRVWHIRLRK